MKLIKNIIILVCFVAVVGSVFSCGGGKDDEDTAKTEKTQATTQAAADTQAEATTQTAGFDVKSLEGKNLTKAMKEIKKAGYKATYYADGVDFTDFIDDMKDDYVVDTITDNGDNTIDVDIITKDSAKNADVEKKLEKNLEIGTAWITAENYGEELYPYGFELHYLMGVIAQEAEDENTWFLKAECTVTNEYGAEMDATCEAKVTGTTDSPEVTYFDVY